MSRVGHVAGVGAEPGVKDRFVAVFLRMDARIVRILPDGPAGHDECQHDAANANGAYRALLQLAPNYIGPSRKKRTQDDSFCQVLGSRYCFFTTSVNSLRQYSPSPCGGKR